MVSTAKKISFLPESNYFGSSEVVEIDASGNKYLLSIIHRSEVFKLWASSALPFSYDVHIGDQVLAAGDNLDCLYVIGVVNAKHSDRVDAEKPSAHKELELINGTRAVLNQLSENELLAVYSKNGDMIFQYDSAKGISQIHMGNGDVEFVAKNGSISFVSDQNIRFLSKQSLEFKSYNDMKWIALNSVGKVFSSMKLTSRRLSFSSPDLKVTAQRGEYDIEDTRYFGKRIRGKFREASMLVGNISITANDVVKKVKNAYTSVTGVSQLKAYRLRTLILSTSHFKAKKVFIKAEKDVNLRGEKINLG